MPGCDLFVIGASAGGVEALVRLVRGLPAGLPASLFVVLHTPPESRSVLPEILNRTGPLPAAAAVDGEPIEHGRIYVAPPDRHLTVERGFVRLVNGPRENRHRPAIDPLFRSAAIAYGPRVAGIILSGTMDDGTAGLVAIKRRGGLAIVQDPAEALFTGMIDSAIAHVDTDYCLPLAEIAETIVRLSREANAKTGAGPMTSRDEDLLAEEHMTQSAGSPGEGRDRPGVPSVFACPDCGGVLWDLSDGQLLHFRCRVGHAFNGESLLGAQTDQLEAALWSALRALEEKASLARKLASRAAENAQHQAAERFEEQHASAEHSAAIIRSVLLATDSLAVVDRQQLPASEQPDE